MQEVAGAVARPMDVKHNTDLLASLNRDEMSLHSEKKVCVGLLGAHTVHLPALCLRSLQQKQRM